MVSNLEPHGARTIATSPASCGPLKDQFYNYFYLAFMHSLQEASYKPESSLLPLNLKPTHETALLTVTMATSGNILLNKSSGKQPLEKLDGQISGTYIVLLSWFLSLVPKDLDYLNDPTVQARCGASGMDGTPFRVVGLQQVSAHFLLIVPHMLRPQFLTLISLTGDKDVYTEIVQQCVKERKKPLAR